MIWLENTKDNVPHEPQAMNQPQEKPSGALEQLSLMVMVLRTRPEEAEKHTRQEWSDQMRALLRLYESGQ